MNYETHPVADIFPMMPQQEFERLRDDIEKNGLLEPIWLYEDQIIDGRHRYAACLELGIEADFREYDGHDPIGFTVSLNLTRRHLNESQRAMVAASLANMVSGGTGANQHNDGSRSANLQSSVSQSEAATLLQVSPRSVATAAKIERDAPEQIVDAVKAGVMSLNLASQVASLPTEEKEAIASAPPEEIKAVAKAHVSNNSGKNEWYTPKEYIDMAREVMGSIDTDPATSELANQTVGADLIFTEQNDGRGKTWRGNVWMNPPYAQPLIADFCEAVANKYDDGEINQACILVNNATETAWFQRLLESSSAVCFPRSRVKFIDPDGKPSAPLQGQAVVYLGEKAGAFSDVFSVKGKVMKND